MSATVIRGDARCLPLADASVDLVITSPPYWSLRSYTDGCADCSDAARQSNRGYMERYCPQCGEIRNRNVCQQCGVTTLRTERAKAGGRSQGDPCATCNGTGKGHYERQIGSEKTPAEYVDNLIACTREWVRVLKPSGSLWVNLGDKYAAAAGPQTGKRSDALLSTEHGHGGGKSWPVVARGRAAAGFPQKSLIGLPWRYALRCIDDLGLILRAEVIWSKPNGLPESVTDRVRRSHETWFAFQCSGGVEASAEGLPLCPQCVRPVDPRAYLVERLQKFDRGVIPADQCVQGERAGSAGQPGEFCGCVLHPPILGGEPWLPQSLVAEIMQGVAGGNINPQQAADYLSGDFVRTHSVWFHLVKSPRYFSAVDTIREAHATHDALTRVRTSDYVRKMSGAMNGAGNPLGKLPGSVWEIPTEPLTVPAELGIDHFAAFPTEWPRRIIQGWSPSGICTACGEGRRPVAAAEGESYYRAAGKTGRDAVPQDAKAPGAGGHTRLANGTVPSYPVRLRTLTGEACACPEPTAPTCPAVVLDPFGGTGTAALVADALRRHGISVDMSADYCRLARWRTTDPGEIARAMQVPKPPKQADGQGNLFEVVA